MRITKANPQSLKTIHIVLFEPSMVNDFKVTVQEKFKALQVFPWQNAVGQRYIVIEI